ncbi:MAG: carboxypeptidase-like regulatory domain-containing protein, partial [Bacteroidia bacterium]|nr:carboxypeptidase-like regulatory domain-containing protein [Bacteroidia bacterium]
MYNLNLKILFILLAFPILSNAQLLTGNIKDSLTKEVLIGAIVKAEPGNYGTATDASGNYQLKLPAGNYTITVTYLGYSTKSTTLTINSDKKLNFSLAQVSTQINDVIITGERTNKAVTSTEMSRVELKAEQIKTLPVIFGEPDVLKAITLLPGIKSGGEGGTGFYVRGGGPDQNLILMDDAVIYNASHLLGFLSVFNTDAVRNLEIIKGGIPANYGGRISSILNVNMVEGNENKYKVNGGIGLISSRLMVEGPIKKNKSAFMIAARRTYIDALVKPFLKKEQQANGYYFYDFNAK